MEVNHFFSIFVRMNRLIKYIHTLLREHDYVIVSDLGGFVVQYEEAEYMPQEQLFLPPYKTLSFNPRLTMNDGLLTQTYMDGEQVDFAAARQRLRYDVEEVKEQLHAQGVCQLESIGTLYLSEDGLYTFEPAVASFSSPQLYGLEAFEMEAKAGSPFMLVSEETMGGEEAEENFAATKGKYTLRISREWVNNCVAIVAAVMIYFLWASPVNKMNTTSQAAFLQNQLFSSLTSGEGEQTQEQPIETSTAVALTSAVQTKESAPSVAHESVAQPKEEMQAVEPAEAAEVKKVQPKYTIVLASCITKKNAEAFVRQINDEGFTEARITYKNHLRRVEYSGYATIGEVRKALRELRSNFLFKDAWVLRLK